MILELSIQLNILTEVVDVQCIGSTVSPLIPIRYKMSQLVSVNSDHFISLNKQESIYKILPLNMIRAERLLLWTFFINQQKH